MPAPARITIIDVAAAAGVSKSAASRALLDQPGITEAVREHVKAVAAELGYSKDFRAHSLRSASSQTVAVYVRSVQLSYYGELVQSIQQELEAAGYRIAITSGSAARAVEPSDLLGLRPAAIIVASGRVPTRLLEQAAAEVPVVLAGPTSQSPLLGSVSDDGSGTAELSRRVVAFGHRRVGVLAPAGEQSATLAPRSERLIRELAALGIEALRIPFAPGSDAPERDALLRAASDVTAIMCPNDPTLLAAWEILDSAGYGVPNNVSLTGYDGIGQLASPIIGLTTWRQPIQEMGALATQHVLARLHDPEAPPVHRQLAGEFIPGRTLGASR